MAAPVRNDDGLKARLASLGGELADARNKAREHDAVRERPAHLEREHEALRREIDARTDDGAHCMGDCAPSPSHARSPAPTAPQEAPPPGRDRIELRGSGPRGASPVAPGRLAR